MKNYNNEYLILFLSACLLFSSCSKDSDKPSVQVENVYAQIDENPEVDLFVAAVSADVKNANNGRFYFDKTAVPGDLSNYIALNSAGVITISDPSHFDYEKQVSYSTTAVMDVRNESDESATAQFTITIELRDVGELSVQERLNAGETPLDIYQSNGNSMDSLYGKVYQGGQIFYMDDTDGSGLVAAPMDQSAGSVWDPNDSGATGAIYSTYKGGQLNTPLIVSTVGAGSYAAQICNDLDLNGYTDWYLPSGEELGWMYENLRIRGFGTLKPNKYWSSTENTDGITAWRIDLGETVLSKIAQPEDKKMSFYVRAARVF